MSVAADPLVRRSRLAGGLGAVWSLLLGTLLCMTPVTSVIVLGWLVRRMRFVALRRVSVPAERPRWIVGQGGTLSRLLGGLAANVRSGLSATVSLGLACFPFAALWTLSWWAGWENSFSKGYEQAWVGPSIGLIGAVLFCITMIWLPMALAHQAVEDRFLALFDWRRVRSAVRHSGWSYVVLGVVTVIFALPLFAARGLIAFASDIVPGFDSMTPEQIAGLASTIALVKAGYVFTALVILRGWAARVYAVAVSRALHGPDAALWQDSPLSNIAPIGRRGWQLTHGFRVTLLAVIWFGLVAQIYVAQFLNHDWAAWLTHPLIFLPYPV